MDNIEADLKEWGVCRVTVRARTGTYALTAMESKEGYWVSLTYWQDYPPSEYEERTLIEEKEVPTPYLALELLRHWYRREKARGWAGYSLKLDNPFNAGMLLSGCPARPPKLSSGVLVPSPNIP